MATEAASSPSSSSSSSWRAPVMKDRSSMKLLPLLRLLFREEALTLCAYLSPSELAELVCVATWSPTVETRKAMWRAYYVLRWGPEQGAGPATQVHPMRSWMDGAWPAPWPLAVGFCGARTALDHLF
ncbi:unnamed protein product, partial [Polarella glacialis]